MLVNKAVQLALLATLVLAADAATTAAVKLCGRKLSDIMSRVCHAYNSPVWDDPTVVEQPASLARRKRQIGIADQCCTFGCTWEQLNEYCAISANSESPLDDVEAHMVAEHSGGTERKREAVAAPATMLRGGPEPRLPGGPERGLPGGPERGLREVGAGGRRSGYGRRGRRCWCRRRRQGRRRALLMGNTDQRNARPAAVVGTVSPLLTWGRTLNTELPLLERERYNYIAVYS